MNPTDHELDDAIHEFCGRPKRKNTMKKFVSNSVRLMLGIAAIVLLIAIISAAAGFLYGALLEPTFTWGKGLL